MEFNKLVPELSVTDIDASKHFYIDILKFKLEYERKDDKFAFLSYNGSQIMIEQINDNWNVGELEYPFGRGINFQIETDEIEEISKRLKENNIKIYKDIFKSKYVADGEVFEESELLVQDPDGYLLRFQQ
ncbi:MAG: VOC family protein [Phascolarctobacterium sp.]|nr:VOC family protein [Phascolarctobacterium sp.]